MTLSGRFARVRARTKMFHVLEHAARCSSSYLESFVNKTAGYGNQLTFCMHVHSYAIAEIFNSSLSLRSLLNRSLYVRYGGRRVILEVCNFFHCRFGQTNEFFRIITIFSQILRRIVVYIVASRFTRVDSTNFVLFAFCQVP